MSKLLLVEFYWDAGRMGHVEGLFVATEDELEKAYGKYVYFGEILGKHSEVSGTLDREDITIKSDDQVFIGQLTHLLGDSISGYNPLDYIQDGDEEE